MSDYDMCQSLTVSAMLRDAEAEIVKLRARIAEHEPRTQWRPIAEAPRDGARFLAMDRRDNPFEICQIRWVRPPPDVSEGWFEQVAGDEWWEGNFTHWIPMPPLPPEDAGE